MNGWVLAARGCVVQKWAAEGRAKQELQAICLGFSRSLLNLVLKAESVLRSADIALGTSVSCGSLEKEKK